MSTYVTDIVVYSSFFITAYLLASIEEWLAHKYIMHTKMKSTSIFDNAYINHIKHHKNTNNDYSIKTGNPDYICFEIFSADGIVQSFVVLFTNSSILFVLYPSISAYVILSTNIFLLVANIFIWNTFHAYIHNMDAYKICSPSGLPRYYIKENNMYSSWLINNHKCHHTNSKGNFNIVFPGADFIFGTHNNIKYE